MDLPVSWPPSSAIVEAVGPMQPPILTVESATTTLMAEPAFSYMPSVPSVAVGSIAAIEESPSTIFLEQDAPSGSYSIDIHSMEGAPIIASGLASFVPASQSVVSSTPSTEITMAQLIDLMPWNGSYIPSFTFAASSINQNSDPDMWQLQGDPIVEQPLAPFNQSTLLGIQMGHSRPSMNQNSWNKLIIPDRSQPTIGMKQPGVHNNTSSVHQNSDPNMWQLQGDLNVGQHVPAFNQSTLPGIQTGHSGLSTNQDSWNRLIVHRSQPMTGMQQLGGYSNTSSVHKNSGPEMWQLRGDPSVRQSVPALGQSSLPGIQTGHSGPSTNQNSWDMLVLPDKSQPMSGMQQLGVNNNTSSVDQNSGPDMWQLLGDPSVGQPVPALNQSTLPSIQTGHSGPSTNQNSWDMLFLPDKSQPMTGMQQLGVNNNPSSVNQNLGPDMWQLLGDPSVGQLVPALNQSTLPSIQTGHSVPSTNQNSWNMQIIPDRSQTSTGMQQLGGYSNTSSVHQNSGPDMWQLQGDSSVGQSLPAFNQFTLPDIQTGGPSTNQNSWNRLIVPDRSQPMTGMKQLGVNNNTSSVHQSSGPDMWQLLDDPCVSHPVPALGPSTLSGIQTGHSGPSTNQNSWNRLIRPDRSQPMTGMQQLGVNNNTTSVHQNSNPDMWQLQGNPSVGQPVPALGQSTLPGIQPGHSGPSTNQNSWNRLNIPDRSQPLTGSHQLGVNNDTSRVHQNSGPDMWQLHCDPSVEQSVPAFNQSTLPGILMGHVGPSTNQNSWNSLIIPDISQPVTGMQQLGVNNNTSNVNQNSGPDMLHLQSDLIVGQPVPALNQSILPGIQTGHSGSSMNQNSWNILATPDISQPMTGVQQLGVNNNTTANMPHSQPRTTASRSEFSRFYKGYLYMRREGQLVFLTRIEGFTSGMSSGVHSNWPRGLQILRLFNFNQTSYRDCIEIAGLIPSREMIFRVTKGNQFLRDMQEENICAVIELPWAVLYLFVSDEVHLEGVLCPTSTSQQLEQMLRGVLRGYPPCQTLFMLRLLQQDPSVHVEARRSRRPNHGDDGGEYQRELHQFQQRYIGDVLIREGFRRIRQEVSSEQQERRRLYPCQHQQALANPLLRPEMRQLFSLQSQMQTLEEQIRQLQQRIQLLGQLHQEQQIGRAGQPVLLTEYEWSRRVIYALHYNE